MSCSGSHPNSYSAIHGQNTLDNLRTAGLVFRAPNLDLDAAPSSILQHRVNARVVTEGLLSPLRDELSEIAPGEDLDQVRDLALQRDG